MDAQHIAASRLVVPTWYWKLKRSLNVGSERRLREALTTVDQFVMDVISKTVDKRNAPISDAEDKVHTRGRDIVSLILANETVDGTPVDPILVRNVVLMALIAGRDTAADALAWLFHLLTLNPRVEEKLRAYLLASLPKLGSDFDYVPDMQEVQSLPYLEATINEALRLYSPVGLAQKLCVRDTVFPDGTFVPKGRISRWCITPWLACQGYGAPTLRRSTLSALLTLKRASSSKCRPASSAPSTRVRACGAQVGHDGDEDGRRVCGEPLPLRRGAWTRCGVRGRPDYRHEESAHDARAAACSKGRWR